MKPTTIIIKAFAVLLLSAVIASPSFAQNKKDSSVTATSKSPGEDAMMKQYIQMSKTNENHQLLASLNGEWSWVGRHISPDTTKKPFEFTGTITRKAIWEGRYFFTETTSDGKLKMPWSDGKMVTYHDMYLEGYDNVSKKFFSAMINNESNTGLMTMEGSYDTITKTITYEGESAAHFHRDIVPGTTMHFRVFIKFIDNDHYILEHHESIGGKEIVTTEIKYTRIKSKQMN